MSDKIEVGDDVRVCFENRGPICGQVLYTPCATGDCWHIKDHGSQWTEAKLYYVQNFTYMEKLEPPKEP